MRKYEGYLEDEGLSLRKGIVEQQKLPNHQNQSRFETVLVKCALVH